MIEERSQPMTLMTPARDMIARLERLEERANHLRMPVAFTSRVESDATYIKPSGLGHLDLVRSRPARMMSSFLWVSV
jgi:hypothetical protein